MSVLNKLKVEKDVIEDGVIYLKRGKKYLIKSKEKSKNPKKLKVVVDSEIKGIDILIEVDRALVIQGS